MGKRIAPQRKRATPIRDDVTVVFLRGEEEVEHDFVISPQLSYKQLVPIMPLFGAQLSQTEAMKFVPHIDRILRRIMVDDDGTSYSWVPDLGNPDGFTAPDGTLRPFGELDTYSRFEAGSSRRRWRWLMEVDEDLEIEFEQLFELLKHGIELAGQQTTTGGDAARPPETPGSSSP